MQTLTSIRRRGWSGRIASLPMFFLPFFCFLCQGHMSHCASDLDHRGLKMRRSAHGSAFWGPEWCAPKFWGVESPKNWNFGAVNRTFKSEREKIKIIITWKILSRSWQRFVCFSLNYYNYYMTKFLQEVRTTSEASWVVPWLTQTNPRWRQPISLILVKYQ